MPEHNALTGSQLHEPKGVASASSGTVYVSDGAGSGSWTNPSALYASIYTEESDAVTVSSIGTTAQTLPIQSDGESNGITADSSNNRLTLVNSGKYYITFCIDFSTVASGDSGLYEFKVKMNGSSTPLTTARAMSGSSDTGSSIVVGIVNATANTQITVEVESDNGSDSDDITIYSCELTAFYLGA